MKNESSLDIHESSVRQPIHGAGIRLDFLDGIRGLAAMFVVAHHLWRSYIRVPMEGLQGFATTWLLYGHLAVDVFIVLSGFCLMLPVARRGKLSSGWAGFYKGRARRILPPLYAAAILSVLLLFRHKRVSMEVAAANLFLVQDIFPKLNILNGPFWSVAVECKIYLLFPIFVWVWLKWRSRILLLVAVLAYVLYFAVLIYFHIPLEHVCPWYIVLFTMGMIAADLTINEKTSCAFSRFLSPKICAAAGLAGLTMALYSWRITSVEGGDYVRNMPIIDILAGIATASSLVILSRFSQQKNAPFPVAVLSWKPFVFLGTIGYSIYLTHIIFVFWIKEIIKKYLPQVPTLPLILLDMSICVLIAYIFHLFCERPFMSRHAPEDWAPSGNRGCS